MKRQSLTGPEEEADSGSVLTEKWVVPDVPLPTETEWVGTICSPRYVRYVSDLFILHRPEDTLRVDSFLECEELDRLGRFSFNGYNKEIEVCVRMQQQPLRLLLNNLVLWMNGLLSKLRWCVHCNGFFLWWILSLLAPSSVWCEWRWEGVQPWWMRRRMQTSLRKRWLNGNGFCEKGRRGRRSLILIVMGRWKSG